MTQGRAAADKRIVVYSAALVLPVTAPPIVDGAIAVQGGRILHVGERAWVRSCVADRGGWAREVRWDGVLMPGLVNAHTHLQYTGMASVGSGNYQGFLDWARAFNAEYARPHNWKADAAAGARLALTSGTTAAADVVTDHEATDALHDAGLHGIAYWEVIDWSNEDWERTGRTQVERALDALPTPPGTGLSPHAPYSLEIAPLLEIPDIARARGARLHIHLGESEIERALDNARPEAWHGEGLASLAQVREAGFGVSATDYVDHLGVLGPDCHIAHGVYLTARDRATLRARGTAVALCPRSNAVIGLDEPPVAAYLAESSPIAVGTDSLSSSPSLDLMGDVAALARLARSQGYRGDDMHHRLLAAATLGGARAMGLEVGPDRTGYLAVGARADLAFFDVPVEGVATTLESLVLGGEGRCEATVVAGAAAYCSDLFSETSGEQA